MEEIDELSKQLLFSWIELKTLSEQMDNNILEQQFRYTDKHRPMFLPDNKTIRTHILGFEIVLYKKPIAIDEHIRYMEYAFTYDGEAGKKIIAKYYLDTQGSVWEDCESQKHFCDHKNRELAKYLFERLILAVTDSDLTKPSD